MASVVCVGTVTVDMVLDVPGPVEAGLKHRATGSRLVPGGGALIAAMTVARLGGDAHLAGMVGEDAFAGIVRASLATEGVGTGLLGVAEGAGTSRSAVLVAPDGERTIVNYRDDGLRRGELRLEGIRLDGALADTRWPEGAAQLLRAARAAGRPAVMDAEAPVALASEALALATHVAFSEQGLADFADGADEAALARAARQLGAWVCVTRGAAPVLCHDGGAGFEVPAFEVVAIDTLGAGDAWHGAFTLALAEGRSEREAVRFANAVAALKASRSGIPASLPQLAEVEGLLAAR